MGFIFGIVNIRGGAVNADDVRTLGEAVQWGDFDSRIEVNSSYGWGYCWNKKRVPKAGIYTSERVAVLCDARIYNSDELKQSFEFEQPEEAFAKAYLKWGDMFADRFNGDFAAVIIDFHQQQVLLVRDHIGVRPLTYSVKDDLLFFSSHEFGIAKSNLIDNSLSYDCLIRTFFYNYNVQKYSLTVFRNIKKVIPGHVLKVGSVQKIYKYWNPDKISTVRDFTVEVAVSQLREYLIRAVKIRIEDGLVGTHVSGGLDSSGVAAILADSVSDKDCLKGFSWSPDKNVDSVDSVNGLNEKQLVDDFAKDKAICTNYLVYEDCVNIDDFILPEFEQMPIEINTMRQAALIDVPVIFSGWGGDEFVSLSHRGAINHIVFHFKLKTLYRWIKYWGLKSTLSRARREILPVLSPSWLSGLFKCKGSGLRYYRPIFIFRYLKSFFFNKRKHIHGFGNRSCLSFNLLYNYHLPQRMDSWALFGEQFGIEYRFPLLDKQLLEFWISLPLQLSYEIMIPRGLYKEAMKGILPESVRNRCNKAESVLFQDFNQRNIKIKETMGDMPRLFYDSPYLNFFKAKEFYENTKIDTEDELKINRLVKDIRFFLRYKGLVEKYVVTNPYCMRKQKTNSDSETL